MGRLVIAFKAFFRIVFDGAFASCVERLLNGDSAATASAVTSVAPVVASTAANPSRAAAKTSKYEALALLAALQREARLVDFLQEPIAAYSDAEIGAAVRDVHRDCNKVLARVFGLTPIVSAEEGAAIDIPVSFDAAEYRLLGDVSAAAKSGRLLHHGWRATKAELPEWTGSEKAARVIAPAEVEL